MKYLLMIMFVTSPAFAKTFTILLQGKKYIPNTLTIAPGDSVLWLNKDNMLHTATARPKDGKLLFNSGFLRQGQKFLFTFKETGEYRFYCMPHPIDMQGTITVQ